MTTPYAITLSAVILFFLFLTVTSFEKKRGKRVGEQARARLDVWVAKNLFILHHVDWQAFFHETVINGFESLAHRAAHQTLLAVRGVEKFLSRAVATLRERRVQSLSQPRRRTIRSLRGVRLNVPVTPVEITREIMVESGDVKGE